jgi:hypothetical protein
VAETGEVPVDVGSPDRGVRVAVAGEVIVALGAALSVVGVAVGAASCGL